MAPLPVCLRQGTSFAALAHCHSFAAPPASRRLASHSLSQAGPSQSHEYLSSMSCRTQACHSIVLWLLRIVPPVLCTEYLAEHPRRSFKSTRTTGQAPRFCNRHACMHQDAKLQVCHRISICSSSASAWLTASRQGLSRRASNRRRCICAGLPARTRVHFSLLLLTAFVYHHRPLLATYH